MKKLTSLPLLSLVVLGMLLVVRPAMAWVKLETGNASLIGGDITDPEDKVVDPGNCSGGGTEEQMKPSLAGWEKMKAAPIAPPYQLHPYQSWQNSPACAIFLNRPQDKRWYVGFKDGGSGGPTEDEPYYCAVELKDAYVLTHFTLTSSPGAETEREP